MCDITTALAVGSMISGVAGTGMQMMGANQQAQAKAESDLYNAQVARNDQILQQQNAQLALDQGQVKEQAQRQLTAQTIGGLVAQEAASGVIPNTGSALEVRSSAATTGQLNALTIRNNAQVQARNALAAASSYGAQAGLLDAQAGWDTTAGNINMMSSLLGGASSVSDKWLRYQQSGVLGSSGSSSGSSGSSGSTGIDPYVYPFV